MLIYLREKKKKTKYKYLERPITKPPSPPQPNNKHLLPSHPLRYLRRPLRKNIRRAAVVHDVAGCHGKQHLCCRHRYVFWSICSVSRPSHITSFV